jgi:SOS response regulatory protein OraA/RecX
LEEKLRKHGYSSDVSARAVCELVSRGYIDEEKDAIRLCDSMISKKYGPRKVLVALKNRGYKRPVLQKAEAFLQEVDFSEVCESIVRKKIKKLPENRDETKKLVAKLTALGYNVSDIRRALERI